jgi:hypothetical protein
VCGAREGNAGATERLALYLGAPYLLNRQKGSNHPVRVHTGGGVVVMVMKIHVNQLELQPARRHRVSMKEQQVDGQRGNASVRGDREKKTAIVNHEFLLFCPLYKQ